MNQTRKRLRSDEANYGLQSKLFVNQKIMDQSDENLMKNVYDKTLEKLFIGTKMHYKSIHETQKTDKNSSMIIDSIDDKNTSFVGCQSCIRDVIPSSTFQCVKCQLRICTACRLVCQMCQSTSLCEFCVNRVDEVPVCDECQNYLH